MCGVAQSAPYVARLPIGGACCLAYGAVIIKTLDTYLLSFVILPSQIFSKR